jgi:predicted dehydrogenase
MASPLKVGIIGTGTIGTVHSEAMQATGQAELVSFCDIDAKRLAEKAKRFGVKKTFEDYREFLKSDIEAGVVGVPNYLHKQMAIAALEAGKHVMLEKPMTMNAAEAAEVCAAVKKSGKVLSIGMCNRHRPESQVAKQYIDAGFFGNIYHLRTVLIRRRGIPGMGGWFTTKSQSGGGPMIDLGVHWFDLSMFLSGHWKPITVSANTYAKFGPKLKEYTYVDMWAEPDRITGVFDVEDYSTGYVRFEGGCSMVFDIVWAGNVQDAAYIDVIGDKAGVRIFDDRPMTILTEDHGHVADLQPKYRTNVNSYQVEDQKFIDAVRGLSAPDVPAEQGMVTMKLIDAIYASSQANKEVQLSW